MPHSSFEPFVLNAATRHGIMLYIVFVLAFLVLVGYAGVRLVRRELADFLMLLLLQLATSCLFLAFAAVTGQFPKELWLATLAVSFIAWVIQELLIWTARLDINQVSAELTIARAIMFGKARFLTSTSGLLLIAMFVLQLGLLTYCGFLYDVTQMGSVGYQAKIAAYTLMLPAALPLIPILVIQILALISEYTTPTVRNLYLAVAVSNAANSLIFIVGPLYVYRDGFPGIASVTPPLGTLFSAAVGIFAVLLIIPYAVGYLRNRWLEIKLKGSVQHFIARAEELSKRPTGTYRTEEENKLLGNVVNALTPLTKNDMLYFFVLKLLEKFSQEERTPNARPKRLAMLQDFGFGKNAPYENDPAREIAETRKAMKEDPFYLGVQEYFATVEENLDMVAEVHPLLRNFSNLTEILGALVDNDPEREYIVKDILAQEKAEATIWDSVPAWVLTALTGSVLTPLTSAVGKDIFDRLGHLLGSLAGAG